MHQQQHEDAGLMISDTSGLVPAAETESQAEDSSCFKTNITIYNLPRVGR